MDDEKIRQMGREYYREHGISSEIPSRDDNFWNAWNGSVPETTLKGAEQEAEYCRWKYQWYAGFKEAMQEKEMRAIDLLGRAFKDRHASSRVWNDAASFLDEVGWRPKS